MRRRALTLGLGVWALLAAPASAATVTLVGDALQFTAGPGETNVVSVAFDRIDGAFVVNDPGAPLVAGAGCVGPSGGPLVCAGRDAAVTLALGDGDDRVTATLPPGIALTADGGLGDDEINSGDGDDVLRGGPGDDVLDGAFGRDVVDYGDHTDGVVVDLSSPDPAGSAGERDTLSGVERVWGGIGDDRIRAAAAGSRCGAGSDRITPLGDSGLRAGGDCELLAFSPTLAVQRSARLRGRRLRLVLWTTRAVTLRLHIGRRTVRRRFQPDYGGRTVASVRVPRGVPGVIRVTARGKTLALRVRR